MGQKAILKWSAFNNLLFQSGASAIQKGGETVISKWVKVYFKVGQLFQSERVTSKWDKMLLQSETVFSKKGNYFCGTYHK